uniref:Succinate dehydrogenase assembly factor 2, mitochondrial n=1 Tax=Anthurium amnicola TaxID=1678845 RepID=A0A1D1Z8I4_9ARAE
MATLRRALLRLRQNGAIRTPLLPQASNSTSLGSVPFFSSDQGSVAVDLSNEESRRRLTNRLLYRSRQRGFLELDLVLGNWVEENIRSMDELQIRALVDVLDLENPDLWKWLTGQEQPPEAVNMNPVYKAVRAKVTHNLDRHTAAATRAVPGQPWVRGWDDKRGTDGPIYGNQ